MITALQGKFAAYLSWSQPFLHELIRGIEGRGVRCVVLCARTENSDRFPVAHVERIKTAALTGVLAATAEGVRIRRRWQPDLLHGHFGWSAIRMLLLKQILDLPLVTTFGGRDASVQMHLPHFSRLYEVLIEQSDAILCVSHDLRRQLSSAGVDPGRIAVVHRGTDLRRFGFADRSGRGGARVRLLMVGRLVEKKGHAHALRALARVRATHPAVRLDVLGEGEELAALERLARELGVADTVRFHGPQRREAVARFMRRADALVHCSLTGRDGDCEGIPNAVVEAGATGLPVVGTRHGGIPEAVRDGETGLLVPEGDARALAQAIERVVADRELRLSLGKAASRLARASFDIETQIDAHVRLYERLVCDGARPRRPLPGDFLEAQAAVFGSARNAREFSLAELVEQLALALRGPRRRHLVSRIRRASLLERLYDLKRFLPGRFKFGAKKLISRAFVPVLALLGRLGPFALLREREREREQRLLAYFAGGGSIERFRLGMPLEEIDAILDGAGGGAAPGRAELP